MYIVAIKTSNRHYGIKLRMEHTVIEGILRLFCPQKTPISHINTALYL